MMVPFELGVNALGYSGTQELGFAPSDEVASERRFESVLNLCAGRVWLEVAA
jgi:hypothetical protein